MIPASMSLEDCARSAAAAHRRAKKVAKAPARAQRDGAWKGAEHSRLTFDWAPSLVPADDEIRAALPRLRARARELGRNNPYVRQYLNLLRVNVIGADGCKLQAQVRNNSGLLNKGLNDRIETAWADWGRAPTVDGRQTLTDFEHVCLGTVARDGEVFVRLHRGYDSPYGFALEALDPDLLDENYFIAAGRGQPEVRMGVELNNYGRPTAYHFWDAPLAMAGIPSPERRRVRVPADQVIHLYMPDRVNQTRGVTWLAPVMYALNMLDGYEEAEITACRVASSAMAFFTRKEGAADVATDAEGKIEMEANPGTFAFAPEGYDISTWDPQHPHSNYQEFVKAVLRKVASGLGMSYAAFANDLSDANYSSMRSGLLIERDLWRSLQRWWIAGFLYRVYNVWLETALLAGGLVLDTRDPRRFREVRWVPRGWPWVDPSKDTDAGIKEVQTGLGSRTALLAAQGLDFEENLEQLKAEKELAAQYGVDISGPAQGAAKPPAAPKEEEDEAEPVGGTNRLVALALHNGHRR